MRWFVPLLCLLAFPAQADLNLSWQYAADPLVCDQGSSCDVQIIITREVTSDESWPVKEICNTGMRVGLPSELRWTPLNRATAICTSAEVLTAGNVSTAPFVVGRVTDPAAAPLGDYNLDLSFIPFGTTSIIEPTPLTLTVQVETVSAGDHVIRIPMSEGTGSTAADEENLQDATLVNADWGTGSNVGRLDFNGTTARATMGTYDFNSTGFTISLWFESRDILNCPATDCRLISKANSTSTSGHWVMFSLVDNGASAAALRARIKINGTTQTVQGDSAAPIQDDTLYHAVLTYDGTNIKMYLNGSEITLTTSGNFPGTVDQDNTINLWVGGNPPGDRFFDGTIDDVRIWNRALDATEVSAVFGEGLVNPPPPPTVPTAVNDTCQVIEDSFFDCAVLGNDTLGFPPGTITNTTNPTGFAGTCVVSPSDPTKVRVTPNTGETGTGTCTYTLGNASGSSVGTINITLVSVGSTDLATLCAGSGVLLCEGFEAGENWSFFKPGVGRVPPKVVCTDDSPAPDPTPQVLEGDCVLQITHDGGASGPDIGGSVAYDFAPNAVYIHFRVYFNGLIAQLRNFTGANGSKIVQVVEGTGSCSSNSFNLNDNFGQLIPTIALSCGGLLQRVATDGINPETGAPDPDDNRQPLGSNDTADFPNNCTRQHVGGDPDYQDPPRPDPANLDAYTGPCVIFNDDRWMGFELKMFPNEPTELWVDSADGNGFVKVVDLLTAVGFTGATLTQLRRRIFFQSYKTDYDGDVFPDTCPDPAACWEAWYDNFVVSTDCIATCGL